MCVEAENLVLRQQVIVLSRKSRSRVRLRNIDRLIFVWLYRLFPSILNAITVVKPETVIRWHRRGFRAYWRWKSRRRGGRPKIDREICDLIRGMRKQNPLWGAPPDVRPEDLPVKTFLLMISGLNVVHAIESFCEVVRDEQHQSNEWLNFRFRLRTPFCDGPRISYVAMQTRAD